MILVHRNGTAYRGAVPWEAHLAHSLRVRKRESANGGAGCRFRNMVSCTPEMGMGEYRHANHRRGTGRGSYVRNLWASRRVRDSSAPPQPFLLPLCFGTLPENFKQIGSCLISIMTSPPLLKIPSCLTTKEKPHMPCVPVASFSPLPKWEA